MQVTAAMLADSAVVVDGKLYIHGGGWDTIYTAVAPVKHPTLGLVLIFKLEWHEANEDIPLGFELVDEDRRTNLVHGTSVMRVGTPPHVKKGAPLFQPFAQMIHGVEFPALGRYTFRVLSEETELASLPITLSGLQPS